MSERQIQSAKLAFLVWLIWKLGLSYLTRPYVVILGPPLPLKLGAALVFS